MYAFDPHSPEIKYVTDEKHTCFLNSLDSDLLAANENFAQHAVVPRLLSYLSCDTVGFKNSISFSSDILKDRVTNKG